MPKKFVGENSKSAAARARKETAKTEKDQQQKAAEEDAKWVDDDKLVNRKQQRKEEEERKRAEAQRRKEENKKAHDEEMQGLSGKTRAEKVTRAQIDSQREAEANARAEEARLAELARNKLKLQSEHLEENVNKVDIEVLSARSITEAITALDDEEDASDKHPEKRMRAAYLAFEEENLPRLKQEHPTFRLSQLKQILKKEWQKSPQNPLNIKIMSLSK